MTRIVLMGAVLLVAGIAGAAYLRQGAARPRCICEGPCKPDPCHFMWDSASGSVDWSRLR